MYGVRASLIFLGFAFVAAVFLGAIVRAWMNRRRAGITLSHLIGLSFFILLWLLLISSIYIRKALFMHELYGLDAKDVYSIQIGRHDFRDYASILEMTNALRHSRWFEVNHGGWGNSIPLTLHRHSGADVAIDVALYFREPGAIIGPANPRGLGYSATEAFAPDLLRALERHGVRLPDCESDRGRPCTVEQLNP